jgi:betaine-aldehyde dehydrogenase
MRTVKGLRTGIVWVNHVQPTYVETPWGGLQEERHRPRAAGGVSTSYLNMKQVYINLSEQPIGWY